MEHELARGRTLSSLARRTKDEAWQLVAVLQVGDMGRLNADQTRVFALDISKNLASDADGGPNFRGVFLSLTCNVPGADGHSSPEPIKRASVRSCRWVVQKREYRQSRGPSR